MAGHAGVCQQGSPEQGLPAHVGLQCACLTVQAGQDVAPLGPGVEPGAVPEDVEEQIRVLPAVPVQRVVGLKHRDEGRLARLEGGDGRPALGNAPRTLPDARSPSTTSFDASLFKNFRLGKEASRRLQLRVDVINVANHPNFFINPNSSRTLGAFNFTATTRTFTPSNRATAST